MKLKAILLSMLALGCINCKDISKQNQLTITTKQRSSVLDFSITPSAKFDKTGLMFSDQGAWFAYSFPDSISNYGGFSGPFLMTQQNGIWSSQSLAKLNLTNSDNNELVQFDKHSTKSYNSHLEQSFENEQLKLDQKLVFLSGHTAFILSTITNASSNKMTLAYEWLSTDILADGLTLSASDNKVIITSENTNATGYLIFPENTAVTVKNNRYSTQKQQLQLNPQQKVSFLISQSFIFPEYSWENELNNIQNTTFHDLLSRRITEKESELKRLIASKNTAISKDYINLVLTKAHLTLQNNWRIPAGEIKHEGLFPSYHYKWFNGFWSWDSWKHAVGLSYYNTDLAKKHMKLMFEFQREDGFIVDCVYRDTTIEPHNYRDTKPPLSAWAVANIFKRDQDSSFLKEFYPKLKKYHQWWYEQRDHDKDGLCEYGSTDGSLIAAKWESGMDNAIRFDNSKILKNAEGAYSLDQESVDLNAYLFAEKLYLAEMARTLNAQEDAQRFEDEAENLKQRIQDQFYDENDGWFYDTNLEGTTFIKGEGSEGWTALWAKAATEKQAESVIKNMLHPEKFYTKVPFQTMSADHPKFDPMNGYWRGPNWLDQSYFGIKSLRNYGFDQQADAATIKLLEGAQGIIDKGPSIRENYHPMTGRGLYAQNFSWSAAHIIMMLMED